MPRAGLCVLEPNGSLNGTFEYPGTGVSAGVVESVLVTADDKITLGGVFTTYNGNSAVRSIRLNDDGTVDGTYSTDYRVHRRGRSGHGTSARWQVARRWKLHHIQWNSSITRVQTELEWFIG